MLLVLKKQGSIVLSLMRILLPSIPFGEGGIGLHVRQDELEEALTIIEELDFNNESGTAGCFFQRC